MNYVRLEGGNFVSDLRQVAPEKQVVFQIAIDCDTQKRALQFHAANAAQFFCSGIFPTVNRQQWPIRPPGERDQLPHR